MDDLSSFYNGKIFLIPSQQRPYSWDKSQVKDLILDLHTAITREKLHYTGPIFLEAKVDDKTNQHLVEANSTGFPLQLKYILDGQQRVTTVMLIAAYLSKSKYFATLPNHALQEALKDLVSFKSQAQKRQNPQIHDELRMRFSDDGMTKLLSHLVFQDPSDCPTITTDGMRRLYDNYNYIAKNFDNLCQINNDPFMFMTVANHFLKNIILKLVDMEIGFDKYTVFESINNRGKGLSVFDKVKNLFLHIAESHERRIATANSSIPTLRASGMSDSDIAKKLNLTTTDVASHPLVAQITKDKISKEWYKSVSTLYEYGLSSSETKILADLWSTMYGKNAHSSIFKDINDLFKDLVDKDNSTHMNDLNEFVNMWAPYFKAHCQLFTKDVNLRFNDTNAVARENLVRIFDYIQLKEVLRIPLTISKYKYSKDEFAELTGYFEKWVFRLHGLRLVMRKTAVATDNISFAKKVYAGNSCAESKREVCKIVTKRAPWKNILNKFLRGMPVYQTGAWNGRSLYYFLYRVDQSITKGNIGYQDKTENQDEEIEHIMPKSLTGGWLGVQDWQNEDTAKAWIHRIGNLTLTMNGDSNKKLGVNLIEKKCKTNHPKYTYERGRICEQTVADIAQLVPRSNVTYNWQKIEIELHERFYARKLIELWSLPCDCDLGVFTIEETNLAKSLESHIDSEDFTQLSINTLDASINLTSVWDPSEIYNPEGKISIHPCTETTDQSEEE